MLSVSTMCSDFKFEASGKVSKQTTILIHQGYTGEDKRRHRSKRKELEDRTLKSKKRREEKDTSGEVNEGMAVGRHTVRLWQAAELLPPDQNLMLKLENTFENKSYHLFTQRET